MKHIMIPVHNAKEKDTQIVLEPVIPVATRKSNDQDFAAGDEFGVFLMANVAGRFYDGLRAKLNE